MGIVLSKVLWMRVEKGLGMRAITGRSRLRTDRTCSCLQVVLNILLDSCIYCMVCALCQGAWWTGVKTGYLGENELVSGSDIWDACTCVTPHPGAAQRHLNEALSSVPVSIA